ncbi:uncharacterized protein LOC108157495 [Drosophila miranda]|uniref:uncharacterized protein LOC108157495 n=1 Tax=Drosophila miranda TaxID=7229 RepID=UPI0007E5BD81|nr:uncharacterized protein LOC108157495 [Drosophila miranda]
MTTLESDKEKLCCLVYCIGILTISAAIWNICKLAGRYFNKMTTNEEVVPKQSQAADDLTKRLRHYLVNGRNQSEICGKVVLAMEQVNIVPLLVGSGIEKGKLRNILHVLARRMRCLRLKMADIRRLHDLCQRMGLSELTKVRVCIVLADDKGDSAAGGSQLELLGSLTPGVQILSVLCCIDGHFPDLKKVRIVHLYSTVTQGTLEELFRNCPLLQHFKMKAEGRSPKIMDMRNIGRCSFLEGLLLPLLLKSPLAVCQLSNLKQLTLQSKDQWQKEEWLLVVQEIIKAKRFELDRICFDGAYVGAPLNLSVLLLARCTALTEVRLSHCKLVGDSKLPPPLPFSCHSLRIRYCTLAKLSLLLASDCMLQHMDLFNCQSVKTANLLSEALATRKTQTCMSPLVIKLLQSPELEIEYNKWSPQQQLAAKPWLEIEVLKEDHIPSWEDQGLGLISMRFGQAIKSFPTNLADYQNQLDNADLLKEMDSVCGF